MIEKSYTTKLGEIHYWINEFKTSQKTLVMLPGLTADHTLFDKQIEAFQDKYNILVWDAPGHNNSRPFSLDFNLEDKAKWLHGILQTEGITKPFLIGQSMGGYISQFYIKLFPAEVKGFVSIDSAPLQREYYTAIELWLLKHTYYMYRMYPWKALVRDGAKGCATTPYGRNLMASMMRIYGNSPKEYCRLVSHGYRILAEAIDSLVPEYSDIPTLLICGEKDMAGSARNYNKRWAAKTGLRIEWIPDAGHNSNTDRPEMINALIDSFLSTQ